MQKEVPWKGILFKASIRRQGPEVCGRKVRSCCWTQGKGNLRFTAKKRKVIRELAFYSKILAIPTSTTRRAS